MSLLHWVAGIFIAGVLVLAMMVLVVSYLRTSRPRSRKMTEAQMHLNRKTGIPHGNVASTQAATGEDKKSSWWLKIRLGSDWLGILLGIGGVVVFYEGLYTSTMESPSFSTLGSWSWHRWLPLFLLWGILAALVAIYGKGWAKTLQKVLVGTMLFLFVGAPIIGSLVGIDYRSSLSPQYNLRSDIPLASAPQSSWSKLVIPAGGRSELVPVPPGMYIVMAGNGFINHTVYRDGHECSFSGTQCPDGAVAGNYATNETQETNIVSYAFAPAK